MRDPRFLYLSAVHREALASLVYGIEAELGFLALIAKPGMGETTLKFHLLEKFQSWHRGPVSDAVHLPAVHALPDCRTGV